MEIYALEKCWIYNELADIPDEFIVIEKEKSMFKDLQRILIRKKWIKENKESTKDSSNENNIDI